MTVPEIHLGPVQTPLVQGRSYVDRVQIRNNGREVERLTLTPVGSLAQWTRLDPPEVRLWPGESADVSVTVDLPIGPHPRAGEWSLEITARTADGLVATARVPAEVAARVAMVLPDPVPQALVTSRKALVFVAPSNRGNVPVWVQVTASDREGRIRHYRPDAAVSLEPGETVWVSVLLRFSKVSWFGRSVPRSYALSARSEEFDEMSDGILTQAPVVRVWWIVVLLAFVLLTAISSGGLGWVLGPITLLGAAVLLGVALHRILATKRGSPTS